MTGFEPSGPGAHSSMLTYQLPGAMLPSTSRTVSAPGVPDRILALDTMVINFIAILVLYGIIEGTAVGSPLASAGQ